MTPSEAFAAVNTRRAIAFASFLAVAVAVAGCEREHPTHVYPRGGVIRGLVSDGAAIEREFNVVAESVGTPEMRTSVTSRAGLDGRFELTVPNGKYRIYVQPGIGWSTLYYNAAGPVLYDSKADTVLVAGDQHDLEFNCGRVAIDVGLPVSLDGESMYCGVAPVDNPSSSWGYSEYVSNGLHVLVRFVPPGSLRTQIGDGGFDRVYLPPTFDPADADVIEVVAGQELAYASAIDALATLGGSVTGSWQTFGEFLPRIDAFYRPG